MSVEIESWGNRQSHCSTTSSYYFLKMQAQAEFPQAWETVNVRLNSENRTKDGCGHYKQLKCNFRRTVSTVLRGCFQASHSMIDDKWVRLLPSLILAFSGSWRTDFKTDGQNWWQVFASYNSSPFTMQTFPGCLLHAMVCALSHLIFYSERTFHSTNWTAALSQTVSGAVSYTACYLPNTPEDQVLLFLLCRWIKCS